jgi:peptide deformylase
MVKDIIKDTTILEQVSTKADPKSAETKRVIQDLIDTATAYSDRCVGLAAIQIGEPLRVIVVSDGTQFIPFINPTIVKVYGQKYIAEEGCMSLEGTRTVERHEAVDIMHCTARGYSKLQCRGIFAEIMQHEVDHLNGKLI